MPELPEVETMRRGLLPLIGRKVIAAERMPCPRRPISITPSLKKIGERLMGKRITAVERLGKRLIVVTENGMRLFFEPRMTGLVLTEAPPTQEHVRFRLRLGGRPSVDVLFWDRRGLGLIYCLDEREFARRLETMKLGPDACAISPNDFSTRLKKTQRPVKVALLDQSILAGVGNLYASEILHRAKISPRRPCARLTSAELEKIHSCMCEVLEEAIRYEGSTLSDGTYRNALNQEGSYQNEHGVYDRENEFCRICGKGRIRRIVQSQRATFFCPTCQAR
jgi:formamidopyrimidine-DNA glycosylase